MRSIEAQRKIEKFAHQHFTALSNDEMRATQIAWLTVKTFARQTLSPKMVEVSIRDLRAFGEVYDRY